MKRTTVADLRNNFRRVAAWISNGEEIEITRRGKPFARLQAAPPENKKIAPIDFGAQRRAIWGRRIFSDAEVAALREAERAGEDG